MLLQVYSKERLVINAAGATLGQAENFSILSDQFVEHTRASRMLYVGWKRFIRLLEEVGGLQGGVVDTPGGGDDDDQPGEGDGKCGARLCSGVRHESLL